MIRAGEAGGALEVILRRLSEFMERASALRRKVKGAMVYPIVVISVAVGILSFIMITIVPQFKTIFDDFGTTLPPMTQNLIDFSSLLSTGVMWVAMAMMILERMQPLHCRSLAGVLFHSCRFALCGLSRS